MPLDITALRTKYEQAEREAARLAQTWREESVKSNANTPQLLVLQRELYKAVRNAFTLRQQQQRLEIEQARRDLDLIEQRLERREIISDAIIKHRVEELQSGGDLSWSNYAQQARHQSQQNQPDIDDISPEERVEKQQNEQAEIAEHARKLCESLFGLELKEIPSEVRFVGVTLQVNSIHEGGPADRAKIRTGDFLVELNGRHIHSYQDLPWVYNQLKRDKSSRVSFKIISDGGEEKTGEMQIAKIEVTLDPVAEAAEVSAQLIGEWKMVSQTLNDQLIGPGESERHYLFDQASIRVTVNGRLVSRSLYQADSKLIVLIHADPSAEKQKFTRGVYHIEGDTLWLAYPSNSDESNTPVPAGANPEVRTKDVVYEEYKRMRPEAATILKQWKNFSGMELEAVIPPEGYNNPEQRCLTIVSVDSGSPAEKAGIKSKDIMIGLDRWETLSLENLEFVYNKLVENKVNTVPFVMIRDGDRLRGELTITDTTAD